MDGAHTQIDGLETAKGSFDSRQALISGDYLVAGKVLRLDAGANNVDAVKVLLALDVGFFSRVVKTVFFDAQLKVLPHFVTVENLARAQSDVLLAAQGSSGTLCGGGNFFQLLLGGGRVIRTIAGTLFGQHRIEAGEGW